jgi:hypothetical protein
MLNETKNVVSVVLTWMDFMVFFFLFCLFVFFLIAAIECLDALEKIFPHNLHCLLFKGKLEMEQEQYHQAHVHFTKARQVDDQNLEMMDSHADCLRRNGARTQLNGYVRKSDFHNQKKDHN